MSSVDLRRALIGLPPESDGNVDAFDRDVFDGLWWSETIAPPPTPVVLSTEDLLSMRAVGLRAETVRFMVLDQQLNQIGELKPSRERPGSISHDSTRAIARTLEGLFVPSSQIGDLDTLSDRIRPEWLLENGSSFELGVYLFAHAPRSRHSLGTDLTATLVDQGAILDQADGVPVSYAEGTNIADALTAEWRSAGIPQFNVDPTSTTLAGPTAWAPTVKRAQRMHDLGVLAGYLDPYFDNAGMGRSRIAPDLTVEQPEFRYGFGDTIRRNSIVEDDDRLDAPNRYIVVGTSASSVPIVGVYDLPDSVPWSIANRNYVIARTVTAQGVGTSEQAARMAQAIAVSDPALFVRVDFDAIPDPRHDAWNVIAYDDVAYLETGWRLPLAPGGGTSGMHHSARTSLLVDG